MKLDLEDDGWIVTHDDGEREFFAFRGGAWRINRNGALGGQTAGTLDEKIPRDRTRARRYVRSVRSQYMS